MAAILYRPNVLMLIADIMHTYRQMDRQTVKVRTITTFHDDVIKRKHFPRYWPFVRGIHRSPVKSPHKGQWRGALMFTLICARINGWVNTREAGDLRRYRPHYDVIVMRLWGFCQLGHHCFHHYPKPWKVFENAVCKIATFLFRPQCGEYYHYRYKTYR